MCVFRTKETPMELDALEAVRRLTLERDALAQQVKRLEEDAEKQNTSPPASSPRPCPECGKEVTVSWHPCGALFWCDCVACWYHGPTADEPFAAITAHDLFFDRLAKWRDALQAPERRERPEMGTEPTEGTNGASRGCEAASCAIEELFALWAKAIADLFERKGEAKRT